MACETIRYEGQTIEERKDQRDEALERLERYLKTGSVRVIIGPRGEVAMQGWKDRDDVSDVCAYRILASRNSWALRQAVARAEATQGRKVNPRAIAAGRHSHDGGKTFGPGH